MVSRQASTRGFPKVQEFAEGVRDRTDTAVPNLVMAGFTCQHLSLAGREGSRAPPFAADTPTVACTRVEASA